MTLAANDVGCFSVGWLTAVLRKAGRYSLARRTRIVALSFCVMTLAGGLSASDGAASGDANEPVDSELGSRFRFYRWMEDYSDLDEVLRPGRLAKLKHFPLRKRRSPAFFGTLGGDYRVRVESSDTARFGLTPQAGRSTTVLHRAQVLLDLQWGKRARTFLQLSGFEESGRPSGPLSVDESEIDWAQAFVDLRFGGGLFRIGRQEVELGGEKLVGVRDGPNQRRSFDAFRWSANTPNNGRLSAIVGREIVPRDSAFRDSSSAGTELWGLFAEGVWSSGARTTDLIYFGIDRPTAVFQQATAHERRHTLAARLQGTGEPWSWEYLALFQFGEFGDSDLSAWSIVTENYIKLRQHPGRPRLGLRANIASGDRDPEDAELTTFDTPFVNPAYLTQAAVYMPRNLYEVQLLAEFEAGSHGSVQTRANFLWRHSVHDAVYASPGIILVDASQSSAREVGQVYDLGVSFQLSPYLTVQAAYAYLAAGAAIREAGGKDMEFSYVSLSTRF